MSIKKQLFIALQNQLNKEVKGIKWIDKNFGQIQNLDNPTGATVPMPGILIEFSETVYKSLSGGRQTGTCQIRFSVLYQNYANSFKGSPNQNLALAFFDFNQSVHQALNGFSGDCFTPLHRTDDEEDADHKNFIVTTLSYTTIITEDSALHNRKRTLVTAEVNPVPTYENPSTRPPAAETTNFVP